jgi:hypothetical protein
MESDMAGDKTGQSARVDQSRNGTAEPVASARPNQRHLEEVTIVGGRPVIESDPNPFGTSQNGWNPFASAVEPSTAPVTPKSGNGTAEPVASGRPAQGHLEEVTMVGSTPVLGSDTNPFGTPQNAWNPFAPARQPPSTSVRGTTRVEEVFDPSNPFAKCP